MKIFTNIADLKASHLSTGQLVATKGYYAMGDGGQGGYLIVAPQATDGYGNHTLANGNVAILQATSHIDVKQFGAKGDGTTDDTAAIQAAMVTGDVFLPDGTYVVAAGVTTAYSVYTSGAVLELKADSAIVNTPVLDLTGNYQSVEGLHVNGNIANQTGAVGYNASTNEVAAVSGIRVSGDYCWVRNCNVYSTPFIGIAASGSIGTTIVDNKVFNTSQAGIWAGNSSERINILDNYVYRAGLDGVSIHANYSNCNNNIIQEAGYGFVLTYQPRAAGLYIVVDVVGVAMDGNTVTGSSGHNIDTGRSDGTLQSNFVISNNVCSGADQSGISISNSGTLVHSNVCFNNGLNNVDDRCSGISVVSPGANITSYENITIKNNICLDNTRYGISVVEVGTTNTSTIHNLVIEGNTLADNLLGPIKIEEGVNSTYTGFRIKNNSGSEDLVHSLLLAGASIPDSVATDVNFASEDTQTNLVDLNLFNAGSPGSIVISRSGNYTIDCGIDFASNPTGHRELEVFVNGASIKGGKMLTRAVSGSATYFNTSIGAKYLNAGDVITVKVYQNSGGALNLNSNLRSYLDIEYV